MVSHALLPLGTLLLYPWGFSTLVLLIGSPLEHCTRAPQRTESDRMLLEAVATPSLFLLASGR